MKLNKHLEKYLDLQITDMRNIELGFTKPWDFLGIEDVTPDNYDDLEERGVF